MKSETIEKIKQEVVRFGKEKLRKDYSIEELRRAFPFQAVYFSDEALKAFKVQRTLVTSMGQTLVPKIALIIGQDKFLSASREHVIQEYADEGMITKADRILDGLRTGTRKPDSTGEWQEIESSASGKKNLIKIIADLYIEDYKPYPLFMEIKSPRPNLDVSVESKKKILYSKIMRYDPSKHRTGIDAYLALPYNPFVKREKYSHGPTSRIMDMKREVLIGEEMWDKLGGKGTFNELLTALDKAKKELGKNA